MITGHECRRSLYDRHGEWHRVLSVNELRLLRRATGLGQREFAAELSVALETLRTWDSGRRPGSCTGASNDRAEKETVGNIEIILAEAADPKLPEATLDAVLIRNAYHEMPEYRSVLKGVMSGLKPGGILIVTEAMHAKYLSLSRELQVKEHEIAPGIVEAELREAGFEIVERDDSFTTFTRDSTGGFWLIKARRKPAQ